MRSLLITAPLALLALLLAAAALTHALAPDHHFALATLHASTGWLLLPAYPLAALAMLLQRRRLALVHASVALAHLATVAPGHWPAAAPDGGIRYVIGSANLFAINPTPERLIQELVRLDPDVWCLQEVNFAWSSRLDRGPVAERWPHRSLHPDDSAFGMALLSKRPLENVRILDLEGVPMALAELDGITIACVHTEPPRTVGITRRWHRQMAALTERLAGIEGPLVLAGDLNSTRHHPSWQRLTEAAGLHDGHADAGRASVRSWPAPPYWLGIPLLKLDHVLLSEDLHGSFATEGHASGSDHRPLVVAFSRNGSEGRVVGAVSGAAGR